MTKALFLARLSPLCVAILTLACSDANPTAPLRAIEITITTDGAAADVDPDGYTLVFDNSGQNIKANDLIRFSAVHTGNHYAQLNGIAANCRLDGPNPRIVAVATREPQTVLVTFTVHCSATIIETPWDY